MSSITERRHYVTSHETFAYVSAPGDGNRRYVFGAFVALGLGEAVAYCAAYDAAYSAAMVQGDTGDGPAVRHDIIDRLYSGYRNAVEEGVSQGWWKALT